ncbi:NifU-like protein 1, chloroplastic [Gracilariopsis chorda]|uniref:NifU-like protein 1, chloroplastic n=1 Tax=Gracilariopsis chorda TaxID=448386 RepID=A0A2V3J1P1_9FLOR|nr:NifU-like protein 1, chloroplastic [Gracilariopsis chorda]|eukprot:PXF47887.1 NifU-like protein 1, chloroplastic [Gracilariopsis chorda]
MLLFLTPVPISQLRSPNFLVSRCPNLRSRSVLPIKRGVKPPVKCHSSTNNKAITEAQYEDDGTRVIPVPIFIAATQEQLLKGVYALLDAEKEVVYIGMSTNVCESVETHLQNHPDDVYYVKLMTFAIPMVREMKLVVDSWILDNETTPKGNIESWQEADVQLAAQAALIPNTMVAQTSSNTIISPFESDPLANSEKKELMELSALNVDIVLDEVRPFLVSDGGNVSVINVDIEAGRVELELEGACSSCASATTTMKLGIEKVMKERFGDRLREVVAVDAQMASEGLSIESCEQALDSLKETLRGLGAYVSVYEIDEGEVVLSFTGPNNLKYGVEKALLEKVPGIEAVTFE